MAEIKVLLMTARSEKTEPLANVLAAQSDMEVIDAEPARGIELLSLLGHTEVDVLVVESGHGGTISLCAQVLSEYPHLVILAVNPDDRTITLNRSTVESRTLLGPELAGLADEVRMAVEL